MVRALAPFRIDEPRFAREVLAVGGHRPEPLDVTLRVPGIVFGHPAGRLRHVRTVPATGRSDGPSGHDREARN